MRCLAQYEERARRAVVAVAVFLGIVLAGGVAHAQGSSDEAAIRRVLDDEVAAWARGDADGFAKHFAADGTFTNFRGMFFTGREEFRNRHDVTFKGEFRGTKMRQDIVSLRVIGPGVAIAETLVAISDFPSAEPPAGIRFDEHGWFRTRLLQVLRKDGHDWNVVVYHNVDVKAGVPLP